MFHAVFASTRKGPAASLRNLRPSVAVGLAGGLIGTALLWLLLRRLRLGEVLGANAQLAAVIAVAAAGDVVREDAGLIAAIFMGLALANRPGFDVPARRPFFETLVQLIIGVLFISISAVVTQQSLRHLLLPTLALVAVLVLAARPIAAFAATLRTDLTKGEPARCVTQTSTPTLSNEISRVRFWEARLQQRPAGQHSPSQAPLEAYWQIVRPPVRRWLDC